MKALEDADTDAQAASAAKKKKALRDAPAASAITNASQYFCTKSLHGIKTF